MSRENIRPQEEPLDEEERQLIRELESGEWISDEFGETVSTLEAATDELKRARTDPDSWKRAILALHSEERQLIREVETGGRISNTGSVVTDEFGETVSALEAAADELERARTDPHRWKWAILALHCAVQGMMALALRGSNNLRILKPEDAKRFLDAVESGEPYPSDLKMDDFLSLYKKIKSDTMLFYMDSKKFAPQGTQGRSVKRLNRLRNQFIHFTPCTFILALNGLPEMTIDCLNIAWFLAWDSNNVGWDVKDDGDELKQRAEKAFRAAAQAAQEMKEAYALPPRR